MNLKKFRKLNTGLSYFQYRMQQYLEHRDLSEQTIKLRLIAIGNELKSKRQSLDDMGTKAFAHELMCRGFSVEEKTIINIEHGRGSNLETLESYLIVLKDLLEQENKPQIDLNKIF
jgi:hypothetical protein